VTHLVVHTLHQIRLAKVFSSGLRTEFADLAWLVRRPALLARSLIAIVVVMPVLIVLLVRWFDFRPTVEIALVALAISPLPPLLPTREAEAGGLRHYGLGLVLVLAVLSIGLIPLAANILGWFFGQRYVVATGPVAVAMVTSVLAPLAAGMVLRAVAPGFADRIAGPAGWAHRVLLPIAVIVLVFTAGPAVWKLVGDGTVIAVVLFVGIGFAVGHVLGGDEHGESAVLAFSTACRHPGTALLIASANFPDTNFRAVVLLYIIVVFAAGLLYILWRRRQAHHAATAVG
jgi:BASS family bile acid:Na+ symporter